jgi:DNase/tRNase domain of colicin-like bacteriocin
LSQSQRSGMLAALERMIKETPDQGTDATEGARLKVDTGLSQAISGEPPPDPRAEQIQAVENRRIERVGGALDVADRNMSFLTEEQQRMLANRLVAESITDGIKNINVLQMAEGMIKGMIDPRQSLAGVAGGFDKMLTGFANIGNWDAWQRDPLGNLLQIAADITTGLATIFSSILGLAALITAVMVALTIITWGFAAPFTGPVIAWMGTVMTYAGWGAIITGGLAVYLNYLAYIKNLHDAGTAETARELFGNTEQMKQNATDGFTGAMAVVEGIGAVKMGPKLSSGEFFSQVPRSPGAFARQTAQGIRRGAGSIASAPGRIGRGIRNLFAGGKQGLIRFKERIQGLFGRRRPGRPGEVDLPDSPQARQRHQSQLDDARGKRVSDMDRADLDAELREVGNSQPRRVDPGSAHHREYDVEIQANGHTYRRRRDGRGWCRFSAEECGIPDHALPADARRKIQDFDGDLVDDFDDPDIRDLDPESRRILDENDRLMREQGVDLDFDADEIVGHTRITADGRIVNQHLAGKRHPHSGVPFNQDGFPEFDSLHDTPDMPGDLIGPHISDDAQMRWATRNLRAEINANPALRASFTPQQLAAIQRGRARIPGYTWHHHHNGRGLQLVDRNLHKLTGHSGGRQVTGGRPR